MSKLDKIPYIDQLNTIYKKINLIRVGLWSGVQQDLLSDIDDVKAVRNDIVQLLADTTKIQQLEILSWEELSFLNYTRRLLDDYIFGVEYNISRRDIYGNSKESAYVLATKADNFMARILLATLPEAGK